jgi:leucyl aminopeptidase
MKITHLTAKDIESVASKSIAPIRITKAKTTRLVERNGINELDYGVGELLPMNARKLRLMARRIIGIAKRERLDRVALDIREIEGMDPGVDGTALTELLVSNMLMANYEYRQFKTKPDDGWREVSEILFVGPLSAPEREGLKRGKMIAEEVNATRNLANAPGGSMTPAMLARKAQEAVKKLPVKVKVLNRKDMQKLKMGALLGVAQGSDEEPRFIIMEYRGASSTRKPIVLVGKGVTFDTGGINLKGDSGLLEMNMDMSGGAAVIHTLALAARLKLKRNLIGLIPAVENMPSGSSYRPGDVLRSMSGKTIEVLNTDAEGRVILADALTYAKRYKPAVTIDVATLTGAAAVALGQECSAIFTASDKLATKASEAGESSGDYVWRLPLWDEYEDYVKGNVGDVTNANSKGIRYGGAINAAIFLKQFAAQLPGEWMHVDMAPRMTATDAEGLSKGAAGAPVRMLLYLLEAL